MDALLGPGERWLLHPGDEGPRSPSDEGRLALAIGPEGGWVPFERELLHARGFRPLGFGSRMSAPRPSSPMRWGGPRGDAVQRSACTSARASASFVRPERRLMALTPPPTTLTDAARSHAAGSGDLRAPGLATHPRHRPAPRAPRLHGAGVEAREHPPAPEDPPRGRLRRPPARPEQALPRRAPSSPRATRRCAPTTPTTASARDRLLLSHRQPRARLRARVVPERRRAPRRALRRAEPGQDDPAFFTDRVKGELWVGPRPACRRAGRARRRRCRPLVELAGALAGAKGRQRAASACSGVSAAGRRAARRARRPRQGARGRALRDAPAQGRAGDPRARPRRRDQARLRGRHRAAAAPQRGARGRRHLQPARPRGGQRRRLRHHRRLRRTTPARCTGRERRADSEEAISSCWTPASRGHRSTRPTSRARCRSAAVQPTSSAQIYDAGPTRRSRRVRAVKPGNDFLDRTARRWRSSPRGSRGWHPRRRRPRTRCATRTSSTSATRCTTSATCSASTCTTAPRRAREDYKFGKLQAGHGAHRRARPVLPARRPRRCRRSYRGIGVRIEDDVLVTEKGSATFRRLPSEAAGRRLDGEGVEIPRQAHPRLTVDAGGRYRPRRMRNSTSQMRRTTRTEAMLMRGPGGRPVAGECCRRIRR